MGGRPRITLLLDAELGAAGEIPRLLLRRVVLVHSGVPRDLLGAAEGYLRTLGLQLRGVVGLLSCLHLIPCELVDANELDLGEWAAILSRLFLLNIDFALTRAIQRCHARILMVQSEWGCRVKRG